MGMASNIDNARRGGGIKAKAMRFSAIRRAPESDEGLMLDR
jgi:hypothetical protein